LLRGDQCNIPCTILLMMKSEKHSIFLAHYATS
jgi:hypothetical protein